MTETLSTQLCKLAGIEPKCLNEEFSGCSYANDDTRNCCKKYKDNSCIYPQYNIYPDFESDTDNARFNFVRLLEVITVEHSVGFETNGTVFIDDGDGEGQGLAEGVINYINNVYEEADEQEDYEYVEHLKQALASTEFKY